MGLFAPREPVGETPKSSLRRFLEIVLGIVYIAIALLSLIIPVIGSVLALVFGLCGIALILGKSLDESL